MTILEFLTDHYALTRDVSRRTIKDAYRSGVMSLCRFLGRSAELKDFNPVTINQWIAWALDKVSRDTAHSYRRYLLTLWRAAVDADLVVVTPRKIRPIRRAEKIVEGWSAEDVSLLVVACDALEGTMPKIGLSRRLYWRTFISAAWFTGLRLGDILAIRREQIDAVGRLSVVQHKTGRVVMRAVPLPIVQEIDAMRGTSPGPVWPLWQATYRELLREFKSLAAAAGLRGTIKYLRRGSSSECERLQPGAGARHLGHAPGSTVFAKSYEVQRIVRPCVVLPPPIG